MTTTDDLLWQRWDEVDRLLDEVLDLPTEQRRDHLAREAGADPALHDLVVRLLERMDDDGVRLSGPSEAMVMGAFGGSAADGDAAELEPGAEVGRYVVDSRLGRGGMATVYEASRSDGAYRQRVALKVLRRGLDTDDLVRRFLAERQILSSFTHPNIARLLDGGSMPDGRPFLVMELVDGKPITVFADERQLDLRGRLALFLEVSGAVHAAHRQLVVHRDIKPSNILVDADAQVKLLDFGIAKLLEGDPGHTEAGLRLLTPDYASPEQISGDPITTATDVYQLGLLLQELLTGVPPLTDPDTDPGVPPMRPSRAAGLGVADRPDPETRAAARGTTPIKLARALTGDLDIIVGKALRSVPEERYASADELAADVRRYLKGLPIVAHPESTVYRLQKFAARRPLVLPGVAVLVLGVVGVTVALAFQNRQILRERDAARVATGRAVATQTFLVDLLRSPNPSGGVAPDITVVDALQRGRSRIAAELQDEPEVRAALLETMGNTFAGLGRHAVADTLLHQALALRTELHGEADRRTALVVGSLGNNYRVRRDFRAADSALHEELRIRSGLGPVDDTSLVRMVTALSLVRRDLGDADSALALAAVAVGVLQTAGDTSGGAYTGALGAAAYALRGAGRLDSAEVVYRRVLERQRRDTNLNPYWLAATHNNLAFLLKTRGDLAGAEREYRGAIDALSQIIDEGHPTAMITTNNLAGVVEAQGRQDEVIEIGRRRIAAAERYWPNGDWRVSRANSSYGRALVRFDRPLDAVVPLRAAYEGYARHLGPKHGWTSIAQSDLGIALWLVGQRTEAARMFEQALEILRGFPDGLNEPASRRVDAYVKVLRRAGNHRHAEQFQQLLASPQGDG